MTLRFALGLLVAGLAGSTMGCGIITIRTPKSAQEKEAEAAQAQPQPEPEPEVVGQVEELAGLAEAKAKLEAGEGKAAMELAGAVRRIIKKKPKDTREKGWHLIYGASIAVQGLGASLDGGGPVAALVAPGKDPFHGMCFGDYVELCERYGKLVRDTRLKGMRRDGHVSSFYPGPIGRNGLNVENMEIIHQMLKNHPEYQKVGLWVSSSPGRVAVIPKGDEVVVKFRGSAVSWNDERCDQHAGRVKIGGQKFDVKRCRKVRESSAPANLTFRLAKDNQVDFQDPGRKYFVAFDAESFTRRGNTFDLGAAYAGAPSGYRPRR